MCDKDLVVMGQLNIPVPVDVKVAHFYGFLRMPELSRFYQFNKDQDRGVWQVKLPIHVGASFSAHLIGEDGLVTSATYVCSSDGSNKWKLASATEWSRPPPLGIDQFVLQLLLLPEKSRDQFLAEVKTVFCLDCGTIKTYGRPCTCNRDE